MVDSIIAFSLGEPAASNMVIIGPDAMKILLTEDDANLRFVLQMWLEQKGHRPDTANNGKEALDCLKKHKYDILISDVNMPLMNGIELVAATLKLSHQPDLIILLTSRCDNIQLQKQFDSPKVHIYSKPFSPNHLTDLIETLSARQPI